MGAWSCQIKIASVCGLIYVHRALQGLNVDNDRLSSKLRLYHKPQPASSVHVAMTT